MLRLISSLAIVLSCCLSAAAAEPAPLATLQAIQDLSNAQAGRQLPVAFQATVIFFNRELKDLNVQDGDRAIFVRTTKDAILVPGDRVLVRGKTQDSFLPYVIGGKITLLRHGPLPTPLPVSFDDLVRTRVVCRLVRIRGIIRTADVMSGANGSISRMQLLMDGGSIELAVNSNDQNALNSLLDAEVEVTGAAGRIFDSKMQQTGVRIKVSNLAGIKVLKRAAASPWSLPVTPINEIVQGYHVHDLSRRLRVHGVITYYQPGTAVVLQNGARSLWVSTRTSEPMEIGDVADATGYPDLRDHRLTLYQGEILDSHVQAPISPQPATWRQLAYWGSTTPAGHQFDLVSIEGKVITEVREATQDEYVLVSDGQLFTAVYRHPPLPGPLAPMFQVPIDSTIRVSGICLISDVIPVNDEAPFDILLRSFDDITVVSGPPLLNIRNLVLIVGLMLVALVVFGARGWILERKVRQKTAALAAIVEEEASLHRRSALLEQKRSQILEHINGSHPLAGILEEIAGMVSFQLDGAPCWCEVTDGARLGYYPLLPETLRIHREEITARSGSPLGVLFAGFDPESLPGVHEAKALQVGARLATLAIETLRLYSDLLHRSEFDLLTDINNRFSLEKRLDAEIEAARQKAGIFGLIYIDLDDFKQVNDLYGHHVGDLYLQEVARRMKGQLRSHDLLARLGGDEFAVLVSVIPNREGAEEIALRLERSFDEPYALQDYRLHCRASVGMAIYPQDGASRDSLLSAADAAMYMAKNSRKQIEQTLAS